MTETEMDGQTDLALPGEWDQAGARTGTAPFAYAALTASTAAQVRASTDRIRGWSRALTARIIDIGAELDRVKILLEHGAFGEWLAAEFGWSERTAQRYRQVYMVLGAKSDTVSGLEATTLYQLSAKSTPAPVRETILARLEAGEAPTPAAIKAEIAAACKEAKGLKNLKAKALLHWVETAPAPATPIAAIAKARQAAALLLERFGEDRDALHLLLAGADAHALVSALRGGRDPGRPITSLEL